MTKASLMFLGTRASRNTAVQGAALIKSRIRLELKGLSKPTLLRVLTAVRKLARQQAAKVTAEKHRTKKTTRK